MPELIIEAGQTERHYWADLWRYRELFYFLAWRDILVRYKQTVIGIIWAVLRPLLTMLVFTVFARVTKISSGDVPYPVYMLVGLLPWQFFANALAEASNSLVGNANLISKIYFPRLIVPASSVITSFVDFLITAVLLAIMMVWYGVAPDARILLLPVFVLMAFAAAMGAGLWLAALTVKYRDFRYVVPFIVQFGFFLSPVIYSSTFAGRWRGIFELNPMAGIIEGFRWSILRGNPVSTHHAMPEALGAANGLVRVFLRVSQLLDQSSMLVCVAITVALLASGIWYFRRIERSFADII